MSCDLDNIFCVLDWLYLVWYILWFLFFYSFFIYQLFFIFVLLFILLIPFFNYYFSCWWFWFIYLIFFLNINCNGWNTSCFFAMNWSFHLTFQSVYKKIGQRLKYSLFWQNHCFYFDSFSTGYCSVKLMRLLVTNSKIIVQ